MTTTTPTYTQSRWLLDDLFKSKNDPAVQASMDEIEKLTTEFEELRPKLTSEIGLETFLDLISRLSRISELSYHLQGYAQLWFTEDTQNQDALSFMALVEQFSTAIGNRVLFFDLWWKALEDEPAGRLMTGAGDYAYWLEEMRHFKPHTLSEPEEKIINIKDVTGTRAITTLYDAITNRYVFKLMVDGEEKEMTRSELNAYRHEPAPELRAASYQEEFRVYGADGPILGLMYQTVVRDWRNEQVDLRGFSEPISARNLRNDIPDEVVDTLLDTAQKNAEHFRRYFRLKARWLGLDKIRRYDIYAPVAQAEKTYDYSEAADMVLASFSDFDPEIGRLAKSVFDQNRIDSEIRQGKRGGAFCMSLTPKLTPWVMLNYQGKGRDVATMAHELGHAIHALLARDHSLFTFHAPLPLAETASTFGEMMLVDRLLAEESNEAVRRDILFKQMDDAYATIMRQSYFALFERRAHQMVKDGASVDEISDAYLENLDDQFGDSVELADEFRWEWVSIPHIYQVPFYVYAYAFGQLLVLSLYQRYRQEGASFKPKYLNILAAGGSAAPASILRAAGVDIQNASFWQGGFDVLGSLLDDLEAIPVA
ncbi:MAG: M3 family oligoendopeptidase [Anaerolineales bacterium]|nr:M3 family oligoendopeptidase [Anaerolineales bacterium]